MGGTRLGWLECRPRLAAGLGYLGIGVGARSAIVPGLCAIRSLTRWRRAGITPDLAWNLALLGLWTVPDVLFWVSDLYLLAIFIPLPGWLFSISAVRRSRWDSEGAGQLPREPGEVDDDRDEEHQGRDPLANPDRLGLPSLALDTIEC